MNEGSEAAGGATQVASGRASLADAQAEQPNRTSGLTVISAIAPGWSWFARVVLDVFPRTPWGTSTDLEKLSFIQSARWALIRGLPHPDGRRALRYDYLFFESNYNGTLDAYIEAFADIMGSRMRLIWNSSYGFPNRVEDQRLSRLRQLRRPIPGKDFVRYVDALSQEIAHFYSGYPSASNTEVLAGLQADRLITRLRGQALRIAPDDEARALHADQFLTAYRGALNELQPRPTLGEQPFASAGDQRGSQYAATALLPITPERLQSLREVIAALPQGAQSPFAAIPDVHFARLVIVDRIPRVNGQLPDSWPQPYLLLTTTTDGTAPPWCALHDNLGAPRDLIFGKCDGYREQVLQAPDADRRAAFTRYLEHHRLPTGRFYGGYPKASAAIVRSGLYSHAALVQFAREHVGDDPEALLTAFTARFVTGVQR